MRTHNNCFMHLLRTEQSRSSMKNCHRRFQQKSAVFSLDSRANRCSLRGIPYLLWHWVYGVLRWLPFEICNHHTEAHTRSCVCIMNVCRHLGTRSNCGMSKIHNWKRSLAFCMRSVPERKCVAVRMQVLLLMTVPIKTIPRRKGGQFEGNGIGRTGTRIPPHHPSSIGH